MHSHTSHKMTLEEAISDSGSDYQFEKDDCKSSDSEYDAKEKKKLCKQSNGFIR